MAQVTRYDYFDKLAIKEGTVAIEDLYLELKLMNKYLAILVGEELSYKDLDNND